METIKKFTTFVNVVRTAIENGFEVDFNDDMEQILVDAEEFILENCKVEGRVFCELHTHGTSQYYNFIDEDGSERNCSGEIFDFLKYKEKDEVYFRIEENGNFTPVNWFDIPNEGEERENYVFVYDRIVDCKGKLIELYDCFK